MNFINTQKPFGYYSKNVEFLKLEVENSIEKLVYDLTDLYLNGYFKENNQNPQSIKTQIYSSNQLRVTDLEVFFDGRGVSGIDFKLRINPNTLDRGVMTSSRQDRIRYCMRNGIFKELSLNYTQSDSFKAINHLTRYELQFIIESCELAKSQIMSSFEVKCKQLMNFVNQLDSSQKLHTFSVTTPKKRRTYDLTVYFSEDGQFSSLTIDAYIKKHQYTGSKIKNLNAKFFMLFNLDTNFDRLDKTKQAWISEAIDLFITNEVT